MRDVTDNRFRLANGQIVINNHGTAVVSNLQFGIVVQWSTGETDFYVYTREAEFKRHLAQFEEPGYSGRILWRSDRPMDGRR